MRSLRWRGNSTWLRSARMTAPAATLMETWNMLIDALPISVLFIGTIIVLALVIELGYLFGRAVHRRSAHETVSSVSAISGSILGLAAFMLAFSFGIVSSRHDTKNRLVR